ncbi:hypothetical protein GCM10009548_11710 [Streptomyces malaysiensis subsp. malaysiensis]|uniref:Uncharacterized protein n=1 Tax=Streptomyces yatensis TaxID=155177 RepID=A0ABN2JE07_9ACTN
MLTVPDNSAPAPVAGWLWPLVREVKTDAVPGGTRGPRTGTWLEEPVITSMTRGILAANPGDSDPDMDEALRRVRSGGSR